MDSLLLLGRVSHDTKATTYSSLVSDQLNVTQKRCFNAAHQIIPALVVTGSESGTPVKAAADPTGEKCVGLPF